jgi:hypothetical protein
MSVQAIAYVIDLVECPDGAEMTPRHKCLLFCMANHHNIHVRYAYPSVPLLARESLTSEASTKRDLRYLEKHCVIEKLHPDRQGAGKFSTYKFLFLDDPERLAEKLRQLSKGVTGEPLFCPPQRGSEGGQGEPKRGSEGGQGAQRNKEEPLTKYLNHEPCVRDGKFSTATPTWTALPEGLRQKVRREIKSQMESRVGVSTFDDGRTAEQIASAERAVVLVACERAAIWKDRAEKIANEFYNMALHEESARVQRQLEQPNYDGTQHA